PLGTKHAKVGGRWVLPAPASYPPRNMRARFPQPALTLALVPLLAGAIHAPANAGTGWIPPRSVTALLPSASFAPGSTHSIEMTLRANGAPANLNWAATPGGAFALGVSPSSGSIAVPPDSVRRVTLSVTIPALALGAASLSVELTDQIGGGHVAKVTSAIFSASGGMPEVWPAPSSWSARSNTTGAVSFQVHSTVAGAESVVVTDGRTNPDPNNTGALFPGTPPPVDLNLPGGTTVTVAAPVAVVPGFIGPAGDTLDLGLLAAGRAGLMLLNLRTVVDPPFGTWEDFFDLDRNGIDDRILRTIPLPGFATDVAWFRATSG